MKSKPEDASSPKLLKPQNQNVITQQDQELLNKVIAFLNNFTGEYKISIHHLVNYLFISRTQLYIKLKAITGLTPAVFIRNDRLDKAYRLLEDKKKGLRVYEVMHMVGFSDKKNFVTMFKRRFGVVPSAIGKAMEKEKEMEKEKDIKPEDYLLLYPLNDVPETDDADDLPLI